MLIATLPDMAGGLVFLMIVPRVSGEQPLHPAGYVASAAG